MANWSELPRDMLALITRFLPLADTHRFSAVCQNWHSIVKEKRQRPAPEMPWLVLAGDETSGKQRLFNLSEKKHYIFDVPELRGARIVGSSFGWLFAVGPKLDAYLINPFSSAKFALPSLPIYRDDIRPEIIDEHVQGRDDRGRPLNNCFERVQCILVEKAVLSADPSKCAGSMVLIMGWFSLYRLALFKFGDSTWTVLDYKDYVVDIAFFKGQFYALVDSDSLISVDVAHDVPKLSVPRWLGCRGYQYTYWNTKYLISFGTQLLFVHRRLDCFEGDAEHYQTTDFRVFKVNLEGDHSIFEGCTSELDDLEGHALFLGRNCGIVVRASDFSGCMPNSLYFSTDANEWYSKKPLYGNDDTGVYKLEDGSIEHFYPPEIYHPLQSFPIWVVPNP